MDMYSLIAQNVTVIGADGSKGRVGKPAGDRPASSSSSGGAAAGHLLKL